MYQYYGSVVEIYKIAFSMIFEMWKLYKTEIFGNPLSRENGISSLFRIVFHYRYSPFKLSNAKKYIIIEKMEA